MNSTTLDPQKIKRHLKRYKIATMKELQLVLGTNVRMTVFRKLQEIKYRSSYSHRGKYYALEETLDFDEKGLWSSKSIWFSVHGTLVKTVLAFVEDSNSGCSAIELEEMLHVSCREVLLKLHKDRKVQRKKIFGIYAHFSVDRITQSKQFAARVALEEEQGHRRGEVSEHLLSHELKAAIVLFSSVLNEKQRRLYSGLESLKIGSGGDQAVATLLGINSHTVAKGREEILKHDIEIDRIRRVGGGRKSIKKKS
mgnify:FL=1